MPDIKRIARETTALMVVDIQERLLPAMHESARVVANASRLVRGAALLNLSIIVTEQYPKGLGKTVPEIASAVPGFAPMEKLSFSAAGALGMQRVFRSKNVRSIVLCGIEAHVCVLQSCLDFLESGMNVFVVQDAISSRTPENWQLSMQRMSQAGAVIVSTEMILFELLRTAEAREFKQIQELIK